MNVTPRKRWGIVLCAAALALIACGARQLFAPPVYHAAAVVKVGGTAAQSVETECEIVRSEPVLDQVIATLGLEREWGNRYNGGKALPTEQARQLILNRLTVHQAFGASLIEIAVTSPQRDETDRIANAIAVAYRKFRESQRERAVSEMVSQTLKPLEEKLNLQIHQIADLQEQLHQLNVEIETNDSSSVTGKLDSYFQLNQQLTALRRSQTELQEKIAGERLKQTMPGLSVVDILNSATPPQRPVSTARTIGIGLISAGTLMGLTGGWLLKKPRPPKPVRPVPIR